MATYKTKAINSWNIMGRNLKANGHYLAKNQNREFNFDMQLPYLYLPYYDWISFASAMAQFDLHMECSSLHNYCRYLEPCD